MLRVSWSSEEADTSRKNHRNRSPRFPPTSVRSHAFSVGSKADLLKVERALAALWELVEYRGWTALGLTNSVAPQNKTALLELILQAYWPNSSQITWQSGANPPLADDASAIRRRSARSQNSTVGWTFNLIESKASTLSGFLVKPVAALRISFFLRPNR